MTEYEYWEVIDQIEKLRTSPTIVRYEYPDTANPGQYLDGEDVTSYDDMGNVMSTTDENSRTITNTYDKLNRLLTTTYPTGRYTESDYDCCVLEWTKDEDGRETHYAYDDAKRVSKVWTNLSGQSSTYPLVEYVYNGFGEVKQVKTYTEEEGTARVTEYTYDKNGRVTAIDHPSPGHRSRGVSKIKHRASVTSSTWKLRYSP